MFKVYLIPSNLTSYLNYLYTSIHLNDKLYPGIVKKKIFYSGLIRDNWSIIVQPNNLRIISTLVKCLHTAVFKNKSIIIY